MANVGGTIYQKTAQKLIVVKSFLKIFTS